MAELPKVSTLSAIWWNARCGVTSMRHFISISARPVLRPQIVIGGVHEKGCDGRLIDEAVLSYVLAGADDLLRRSGQRALFVRPLERHVSHAALSTWRRQKDPIRKLRAYCPAARVVPNVLVGGEIVHASWRTRNLDSKTAAALDQRFDGVITTETDLRKIVGPANRWFTSKILNKLDRRCRDFIAASPFIVVGSTVPSGMVDLSPRRDSAGFVRCLDDTTLAIPDRRRNRRVDTFQNLRQNPGIGLILFVPGQRETLRVTGWAIVVRDRNIRNAMADHGQMPDLAMIVKVEKAFFHCGKCITRSKLWNSRL
jgi:uncharacterized protein